MKYPRAETVAGLYLEGMFGKDEFQHSLRPGNIIFFHAAKRIDIITQRKGFTVADQTQTGVETGIRCGRPAMQFECALPFAQYLFFERFGEEGDDVISGIRFILNLHSAEIEAAASFERGRSIGIVKIGDPVGSLRFGFERPVCVKAELPPVRRIGETIRRMPSVFE